jgi:hypothetical protein
MAALFRLPRCALLLAPLVLGACGGGGAGGSAPGGGGAAPGTPVVTSVAAHAASRQTATGIVNDALAGEGVAPGASTGGTAVVAHGFDLGEPGALAPAAAQ